MEDYPHTLAEFEDRFTTEDACRAYLVQMRWPTGFRCPVPGEIGLEKELGKGSSTTLREDRLPEAGQGVLEYSAFDCTTGRIMSNS